jgi:hypothetical protein
VYRESVCQDPGMYTYGGDQGHLIWAPSPFSGASELGQEGVVLQSLHEEPGTFDMGTVTIRRGVRIRPGGVLRGVRIKLGGRLYYSPYMREPARDI